MKSLIGSQVVLDTAIKVAQEYVNLVIDRDPDDGEHVVPGELRRFLGRLRLLHGVPFSYLVPDERLLPKESIRFFYLDRAWTDALVQGALSVGTVNSADRTQLESVYTHIRKEVDTAERAIRRPVREQLLGGGAGSITGFLLRSKVVSGWPNLHVRAYSRDVLPDDALSTVAESDPRRMKVLRMERLAPAVLLVLIDGVPEVVHVEEPRQGIQFGVRFNPDDPPAARRARFKVRDWATAMPVPPKDDYTNENSGFVPFRPNAPGVVNVRVLAHRIRALARTNGVPPSSTPPLSLSSMALEPNEFAVQMLKFPFRQVFGDPDDREGSKFAELDTFKVTTSLPQWKQTMEESILDPGGPVMGGGQVMGGGGVT